MRHRWLNVIITAAVTLLLGAGLTATIYWTLFDPKWIVFLGGVLFAAVIAMASQTSKAQWLIMRRTKQLEKAREQMSQESTRTRHATEAARLAEQRMRLLTDALPEQIFYVDREELCMYHNRTTELRTGLSADEIKRRPIREILGTAYLHVAPHVPAVLAGNMVEYQFEVVTPTGIQYYSARHVPFPPDSADPNGFYLILIPQLGVTTAPVEEAPAAEPATPTFTEESGESGETLYLRSVADELMGWEDPRAKLETALRNDDFLLFAQGMSALKEGLPDPRCFEILLRLREEEDNLLPPGGFIPVAERYNMMEELDRWVVRHAFSFSESMQQPPLLCINLSEETICSQDFARFVRHEAESRRFKSSTICFEIGEPEIIAHHGHVERLINTLRPLGFRFTVDAFGSVKVSFTHLRGLAIHAVKIDGIIIQNILRDPAELAKLRAISTVCRKFNLRTIAEFVESPETVQALKQVDIDYAQGFGIALPGPIEQAVAEMR